MRFSGKISKFFKISESENFSSFSQYSQSKWFPTVHPLPIPRSGCANYALLLVASNPMRCFLFRSGLGLSSLSNLETTFPSFGCPWSLWASAWCFLRPARPAAESELLDDLWKCCSYWISGAYAGRRLLHERFPRHLRWRDCILPRIWPLESVIFHRACHFSLPVRAAM